MKSLYNKLGGGTEASFYIYIYIYMYIFIKTCLLRQATPEVRGVKEGVLRSEAFRFTFLTYILYINIYIKNALRSVPSVGWRS